MAPTGGGHSQSDSGSLHAAARPGDGDREVPVVVVEATAMVIVDDPEPGAAIDVGLKLTVTPVGWPADNPIAESNPPETVVVIVDVPLEPGATESELGEGEMVKFAPEVTVNETVVVCVMPPPVPVTVIG